MSVDPAAVNAAAGSSSTISAAQVEALLQAEFDALAADAAALASKVTTGQVVTATVLPSNGMTDLISILGSRVAAQLPPTLTPGETFTAQVTGFDGPQILLQMLSTVEPPAISDAPPPGLTNAPAPDITPTIPTPLQAAASGPVLPEGVTPSIAPPPAVFVAASVRQASAAPPPGAPIATPPPSAQTVPQVTVLADIEARLVAARAGQVTVVPASSSYTPPPASPVGLASAPPPPPVPVPQPLPGAAQQPPPGQNPAPPPLLTPGRYAIPPTIIPSARFNGPPPPAPVQTAAAAPEPPPTGIAAYRDPQALVRALNLPVTPTNLAAARLAIDTPQRLPAALATLESALPQSDDPRVATLRTLTAFFGKIDPQSPQLAAQISAFVDNVVTGNEPKLVQLLAAQLATELPPEGAAASAAAPAGAPVAEGANAATAAVVLHEPTLPVAALAMLAERGAALGADLKTQLLSIVNAPPPNAAGDLVPAASSALTAITAVQINAMQAMNAAPQTVAFTLPMWLGSGYAQARVAIDRDAPDGGKGKAPLDGDNFHIAFVLDTKHLGTVTVDLQTVGRAFSLAVRTENEKSAKTFGDNLPRLTERLQDLRYQVKSAEAGVAPRGQTPKPDEIATTDDAGDDLSTDVNVRA
jgi:hypothetical protein